MDTAPLAPNLEMHTSNCNSGYPRVGCRATGVGVAVRQGWKRDSSADTFLRFLIFGPCERVAHIKIK